MKVNQSNETTQNLTQLLHLNSHNIHGCLCMNMWTLELWFDDWRQLSNNVLVLCCILFQCILCPNVLLFCVTKSGWYIWNSITV